MHSQHTASVLAWYSLALPLLAHPDRPAASGKLTEALVRATGHEVVDRVSATHEGELPPLVLDALLSARIALTSLQLGLDPMPSLWASFEALVSWRGYCSEVSAAGRETFPTDWHPPEPSERSEGGQRTPTPATRVRPAIVSRGAGRPNLAAPTQTVQRPAATVAPLRKAFFRQFNPWCRSIDIDPDGAQARVLRHGVMGSWYGLSTTLANQPAKGKRNPSPGLYAPGSDPGQMGSLSWLARVDEVEFAEAVDLALNNETNQQGG